MKKAPRRATPRSSRRGPAPRRVKTLPSAGTAGPSKRSPRSATPRNPVERESAPAAATARYVLEEQVGFLLRCAHQRASEVFAAVMGPFAVTPTQFAALAKLDDLDWVSQNQLGRLTAMDPATISGVVGRLSARGFVHQSLDPEDARLVRLTLTPAGRAAARKMKAVAAEVSRRTLAPLAPERRALLLAALLAIHQGDGQDR